MECSRSCACVVQNHPEIALRTPRSAPKSILNRVKSVPKTVQERPRAPESAQERPKSVPRASQEYSKSVPRAIQERSRAPKSAPGERIWRPRGSPRRPSKAPQTVFGDRFGAPKLQNNIFRETSVPRLARKNVSKRFFNDFRSVLSNAGMHKR